MVTEKWCKYSNKTDQIDGSNWETCLNKDHNGSFSCGILEFEIHGDTEFEQYMI